MDEAGFWALIAACRVDCAGSGENLARLLAKRLRRLEPAEIVAFGEHWGAANERLYAWPVWDAACVLLGTGVGDDEFRDIRAWIVTHGSDVFERVVSNPDSLADLAWDQENTSVETFDGLVEDAHRAATGVEMPEAPGRGRLDPEGERCDLSDAAVVQRRFPRLFTYREGLNSIPVYDRVDEDDGAYGACPSCGGRFSSRSYQTAGPDAHGIVRQPREFRVCVACGRVCWRWRQSAEWQAIEHRDLDGRQQFYLRLVDGPGL